MGKTDVDWADLAADLKAAAETLGYTGAIWDGNGVIPLEDKDWDELTDEQKKSAEALGMDEDEWEGEWCS